MRDALLELLVDPVDRTAVHLTNIERDASGEIVEGRLAGSRGRGFDITRYIPRFVTTTDAGQRQTEQSFAFKWQQQHTYGSPGMLERSRQWLVARYGFESADDMRRFMASRPRVLDAGCGSGFSTSLWMDGGWNGSLWVGADISEAIDVARARLGGVTNTHFVQADVLQLPFRAGTFDVIFSEGVLHHTPSTERAFRALVDLLAPGGEIMAYIYRRKGPVREFTDDHIRAALSTLSAEDAWAALRPLTALGQSLAELHAEVDVPEDIPLLGIRAGRYDVQRLVYWHFAKLFWNADYSFEENNHVNFDWYHPAYAHRHTDAEIRGWCAEAQLAITHFDAQDSGYTVRARRT